MNLSKKGQLENIRDIAITVLAAIICMIVAVSMISLMSSQPYKKLCQKIGFEEELSHSGGGFGSPVMVTCYNSETRETKVITG